MEKKFKVLCVFAFIIIIVVVCSFFYYNITMTNAKKNNQQYIDFYNFEKYGMDIASLINKVQNSNENNKIKKDDSGLYIENDTNSIKIDIKFKESEKLIPFESVLKLGINRFVQNYKSMRFKCKKIDFHYKTKLVKYMYVEELT